MKNNLLDKIFEICGTLALILEMILICTFVVCCVKNAPFPDWLIGAFIIFVSLIIISVIVWLINKFYISEENRRLGYIKFSTDERMYFQK